MELPDNLKSLYKHWSKHTTIRTAKNDVGVNQQVLSEIKYLINERLNIYENKELGKSKPYTNDKILQEYRFCNIYRELDRQTVFYHTLLKPLESDFSLWLLNMLFCRSICRTETIERIGLLSFDEANNQEVMKKLCTLARPKYGNAYIFPISVIQKSQWKTREEFFCLYYPMIVKKIAGMITSFDGVSVVDAVEQITKTFCFNLKFLWTEVLIDVAYQYPNCLDLYKRFPIGPGAVPTMKMLNRTNAPEETNLSMVGLIDNELNLPTYNGKPIFLSAENWEGIGCEFRKYTNLKNGKGRKRRYRNLVI